MPGNDALNVTNGISFEAASWADSCAPTSWVYGGRTTDGNCLLPDCLAAHQQFPNLSWMGAFEKCRRSHVGRLSPTQGPHIMRAFADRTCESRLLDQSVLNWHAWCHTSAEQPWRICRPRTTGAPPIVQLLPPVYNLKWNGDVDGQILATLLEGHKEDASGGGLDATKPAVVHFPGPNKPWTRTQQRTSLGKLWLSACPATAWPQRR